MTNEYTEEQRSQLVAFLRNHDLSAGLGTEESPCSVEAINLAMTGRLTDKIPPCMSEVLGRAVIALQDAIPDEMRNSAGFKALLPDMAGTGRDREQERLNVLMDWMWATVLTQVQPLADKNGFGADWQRMCRERTEEAADAAYRAADATEAAEWAEEWAERAAYRAAKAAEWAERAAEWAERAAEWAADAVEAADWAADAVGGDFWREVNPIGVLERMTYLGADGSPST